jgi:hypothetical protein
MEEKHPPELDPDENLRADNEMSALNLEMKYGAKTFISDDAPPEAIEEWLKNVADYEEQFKNAPKTTIYAFIGSPPYAAPDLLDESTLPGEIERLEKMLYQNGIAVTQSGKVPPAEYYRFLVEDVFPHEHTDIRAPSMMTMLSYDEFHPDPAEMVRTTGEAFLMDLLDLNHPFEGSLFGETLRDDHNIVSQADVLKTIHAFRDKYRKIIPVAFQPDRMTGDPSCIYFMFGIRWEGEPFSGGEKEAYEGLGVMQLAFENKAWRIQGVNMPGFKF